MTSQELKIADYEYDYYERLPATEAQVAAYEKSWGTLERLTFRELRKKVNSVGYKIVDLSEYVLTTDEGVKVRWFKIVHKKTGLEMDQVFYTQRAECRRFLMMHEAGFLIEGQVFKL